MRVFNHKPDNFDLLDLALPTRTTDGMHLCRLDHARQAPYRIWRVMAVLLVVVLVYFDVNMEPCFDC